MKGTIIFFAAIAIFYIVGINIRNREFFAMHRLVAWVVSEDSHQYRCNLSLLHYVHNAQVQMKILSSRHISGDDERKLASVILNAFSSHLADLFFSNKIDCPNFKKVRRYSRIDGYDIGVHFFMFQLYKYLKKHECDSHFLGYDMHQKTISYESKGSWGGPLFNATYELSDFGLVFHKMLYITYKFCSHSSIFTEEVTRFVSEESFTNVIDSRRIDICRH